MSAERMNQIKVEMRDLCAEVDSLPGGCLASCWGVGKRHRWGCVAGRCEKQLPDLTEVGYEGLIGDMILTLERNQPTWQCPESSSS
jgi:hypothetical protein